MFFPSGQVFPSVSVWREIFYFNSEIDIHFCCISFTAEALRGGAYTVTWKKESGMDMQMAIVAVLLAVAVGVVLFKIRKALRSGGCSCGCSSCGSKSACRQASGGVKKEQ